MKTFSAVLLLILFSTSAFADFQGPTGRLAGLRIVNSAADNYSLFRGSIWVSVGTNSLQEYRWGGSACPGKNLTPDEVLVLSENLNRSGKRIIPIYLNGQGGTLCLIEYILIERRYADQVEPFPFP